MSAADDAAAIAAVLNKAFREYEPYYTAAGFAATSPTSNQLQNRMKEGPVWVALQNGLIVGTAAAVPQGEKLYIRGMAVLPEAGGQKVGQLLLTEVESYAAAHGFESLFLSTTPFLNRAIRLYENFGFHRSREGEDDLFGTPLFTMVKTIGSGQPDGLA